MNEKDYLVWVSTESLPPRLPALFGVERNFDVLLHTYGGYSGEREMGALYECSNIVGAPCWTVHQPGEKLNVAGRVMRNHLRGYRQFAFLDDDLSFTTDELNRAFAVGDALRLPLYQPALTPGSYYSHPHTVQVPDSAIRKAPFVEIQMPIFSRLALETCLETFDLNFSGWGLDLVWARLLDGQTFIVDKISVGHYRMPTRRNRIFPNKLTCQQELWIIQKIYGLPCAFWPPPGPFAISDDNKPKT